MELHVKAPILELQAGQLVTLHDARGTRIQARSGSVWVTEEGSRKDHIVNAGDALVLGRPGLAIVQALQPSQIAIREVVDAANDAG